MKGEICNEYTQNHSLLLVRWKTEAGAGSEMPEKLEKALALADGIIFEKIEV